MILIVDDKEEDLFSLRTLLELNGYGVDLATSGEEALKKISGNSYALLLLGIHMTGTDGFEVAETISAQGKAREMPIIFLSSVDLDKKSISRGYISGGMDFCFKPLDNDILLLKVKIFYQLSVQTQQLHELNRRLAACNEELEQFAFVAAHDLKEPLRKIRTYSSFIKEKGLVNTGPGEDYMQRIIYASQRMTQLIENLVTYSTLSYPESFSDICLNSIVEDVMLEMEPRISERSAKVHVGELHRLKVIPGQIKQVFRSVISNALKFSRQDVPPVISIKTETVNEKSVSSHVSKSGNYCRILISDNGIGFDEQYLDKIFMIFQRLNSNSQYEGNGIGLAMVKRIVNKHEGLVTATSNVNDGSTFIIVLPVNN